MNIANPAELEFPSCPLCDEQEHRVWYRGRSFEPYRVVRCEKCAFFYLSPRPTEDAMRQLYSRDDYFSGAENSGYSGYDEQEEALRHTFFRLLRELHDRGMAGGSLLEVGCGYGYLLDEAREFFERREGTDYSAGAVRNAEKTAHHVYRGGLDEIPDECSYHTIIANHVIEHVYRPRQFVAKAVEKLRPGGHLVLSTPDMGSWWRRSLGKRWPSFKLPEHITYFDESSLTRLLKEAGARTVERIPYPHAFPSGLVAQKLGLRVPRRLSKRSLWIPGTTVAAAARF